MAEIQRLRSELAQVQRSTPRRGQDVGQLRNMLVAYRCSTPEVIRSAPANRYRTLCVRSCDGYYFPISYGTQPNRFPIDAAACQSMYAHSGQAELYVQRSGSDVAEAQSLGGDRYGDRPFAFLYRSAYVPTCSGQLHLGIASLFERAAVGQDAPAAAAPVPLPQLRPVRGEDPETVANARGGLRFEPTILRGLTQDATTPRIVGAEYFVRFLAEANRPLQLARTGNATVVEDVASPAAQMSEANPRPFPMPPDGAIR